MHIQARVRMPKESDPDRTVAVTAQYVPGVLEAILGVLEDNDFNLRTAGGRQIEAGGEFAFWVDERNGKVVDKDHEEATVRACEALCNAGYDAYTVEVHSKNIDDTKGALRAFVREIYEAGLLIEEISVGTPRADKKVPVQAYTVDARKPTPPPTPTPTSTP